MVYKSLIILFIFCLLNFSKLNFFNLKEDYTPVSVIVKPGMKLDEITNLLHENQIIKNKFFFKLWVKANRIETKLKFGEFLFKDEINIYDVTEKLLSGKTIFRKLTIIEGSSKFDLFQKLSEIGNNDNFTIEDIPEYLVANTYNYQITDSAKRILENITKISADISNKIWLERDKSTSLKTPKELFILASIVEKETSIKDEKPKIAGVFFNRLKKKMRLQSDPTVVFSITEGKKKLGRKLFRKDLKFESEFNTYRNLGLPPQPICFPGIDSLISVSKPLESELLYFVAKNKNGEHYFSTNYKDHLRNVKAVKNEKN